MTPSQSAEMLNLLREIRDAIKGALPEPVIHSEISGGGGNAFNPGSVSQTSQRQSQYAG